MAMTTLAADERAALRDAVNRLLTAKSTEADVRRTMATPQGYDQALWQGLAEMGVTGLIIDPEFGGSGAGPVELEEVMEEAGAALLCSPLFASSVMAASLLDTLGDGAAQARWLPGIADGSLIATVCLTGDQGLWTPDAVAVTATGNTLDGVANYVLHGQNAGLLLVVANTAEGQGVFAVDAKAAGVTVASHKTLDATLRLARIEFKGAAAERIGSRGWEAVDEALDVARVALAGEQAGAAGFLFDMTVNYIRNRYQFGRAIGGFQAIKHMAADLLVEKESCISAARHAARAMAAGADTAVADISLAAFACADSFAKIAFDSIQMHGGIAYTAEYPAHLYLRRARATAFLLGNSNYYRDRYLTLLGA